MDILDKDLASIQEVRNLIRNAKIAQEKLKNMTQKDIDKIVEAIKDAGLLNAKRLGKMAYEETGFGNAEDKEIKNIFASKIVYESIKDLKTVGIINEDKDKKVLDIAVPMGVIAGLIPSTNPTSTAIYKAMISIKAGNSIVFSPHPNAKDCIFETVEIIKEAAEKAGCPENAISCMSIPTIQGTNELMKNKEIALILATGGEAMVKAAYSSGNPAIGVGPGNGPAFIEKSADIKKAVKRIIDSKTFDNGTICASEQSIVVEKVSEEEVIRELKSQGGYILNKEESTRLQKFILRANGTMNPKIVGKSANDIARFAGIDIPKNIKVLIAREDRVGKNIAYSREKLCPILAFYVEDDWQSACSRCIQILNNEGAGHTLIIHSQDEDIIKEFALKKPVSRFLVNTPGSLGGVGASTNLNPALTLGCGAVGGSSTSDNISPLNLINIKKVGFGVLEIEDIRKICEVKASNNEEKSNISCNYLNENEEIIDLIVNKILERLNK